VALTCISCDTVDKQKAYIKNLKEELPANRDLFERVYKYAFTIAKTGNSKQAALDQAIAFWDLLTTSYKKSINKDMWNETLKFAKLTLADEEMSFWTEESSWPSVIDDFVAWVKNEKRGGSKTEVMDEEY
jgi:DCN1-like protein 1/2